MNPSNVPHASCTASSSAGNHTPSKKRKTTSVVWDYFKRAKVGDEVKLVCSVPLCNKNYSVNCSTTTLQKHLRTHGFFTDEKCQTRFTANGALGDPDSMISPRVHVQTTAVSALCDWLIDAGYPFSTVENKKFKKFLSVLNEDFQVPCRATVTSCVTKKRKDLQVRVQEHLRRHGGKFALTTDAWSSRVYRGYLGITLHWVDANWVMRNIVLEFVRFPTPHNAENTSSMLFNVLESWSLTNKISGITTDNASDMISAMSKLNDQLNARNGTQRHVDDFHVRCLAHIVNLAVKDAFEFIKIRISSVRSLVSAVRCSVKRRDLFESTMKNMHLDVTLPSLDVETRWSSTFNMISSAFKAKRVFNMMTLTSPDLKQFAISETEWEISKSVCDFLETAAALTQVQSGTKYSTLSTSIKAFKKLQISCKKQMDEGDTNLKEIAQIMEKKLDKYASYVMKDLPNLARVLDPRFSNDIIEDGILLRRYVTLLEPSDGLNSALSTKSTTNNANSFMSQLLDEDSVQGIYEDEITMFLRNTSVGDRKSDPMDWWRSNESRFPSIATLAKSILCINASSVASESCFSFAGHLLSELRSRLTDENISASILVRSWLAFLESVTQ